MYNLYLQEKRAEEHLQDLQREIKQDRLVANLPTNRSHIGKHLIGRLGSQLIALGTWLERFEQHELRPVHSMAHK